MAARTRIVDGAVGMVEIPLDRLEREEVVVLDDERKAAMVSNLLAVLCCDQKAPRWSTPARSPPEPPWRSDRAASRSGTPCCSD